MIQSVVCADSHHGPKQPCECDNTTNNSWTETTTVELPKAAEVYALTGNENLRSRTMLLNGKELTLGENDELPCLCGKTVPAGSLEVTPGGCAFIVL